MNIRNPLTAPFDFAQGDAKIFRKCRAVQYNLPPFFFPPGGQMIGCGLVITFHK
jgi:hypothetical protein